MVFAVSEETTPPIIWQEAISICEFLIKTPQLSPQIEHLKKHTLKLYYSLLTRIDLENFPPELFSFISLLLQDVNQILNYGLNPLDALSLMYNKVLLPLLKLFIILKKNAKQESQKLTCEIEEFLKHSVFSVRYLYFYKSFINFISFEKNKLSEVNSFWTFIINCITDTENNFASLIMKEFTLYLFNAYKNSDQLNYQFLVTVIHSLGVPFQQEIASTSLDKNKLTLLTEKTQELPIIWKDTFILVILESLFNSSFKKNNFNEKPSMNEWLKKFGSHILNERNLTQDTLKCLAILAQIDPLFLIKDPRLFSRLLVCDRSVNETKVMLDTLLCDILDIHVKLRTTHLLYSNLSKSILALNKQILPEEMAFNEVWFTYEENHLLPIKYVFIIYLWFLYFFKSMKRN